MLVDRNSKDEMSTANPRNESISMTLEEPRLTVEGEVIGRSDPRYSEVVGILNSAVCPLSTDGKLNGDVNLGADNSHGRIRGPKAVCRPLSIQDIQRIVVFARKHSLSISAKSGGYGTAGWSIQGDIVVDLALMDHVKVELPPCASPRTENAGSGTTDVVGADARADGLRGVRRTAEQAYGDEEGCDKIQPPSTRAKKSSDDGDGGGGGDNRGGTGNREESLRPGSPPGTPPIPIADIPGSAYKLDGEMKLEGQGTSQDQSDRNSSKSNGGKSTSTDSGSGGSGSSAQRDEDTPDSSRPSASSSNSRNSPAIGKGDQSGSNHRRRLDKGKGKEKEMEVDKEAEDAIAMEGTRSWVESHKRHSVSNDRNRSLHPESDGRAHSDPIKNSPSDAPEQRITFSEPHSASEAGFFLSNPSSSSSSHRPPFLPSPTTVSPGFPSWVTSPFQTSNPRTNTASFGANPYLQPQNQASFSPFTVPPSPFTPISNSSNPFAEAWGNQISSYQPQQRTNGYAEYVGTEQRPGWPDHLIVGIGPGAKSQWIDEVTSQYGHYVPLAAYPVGTAIFATGGYGFLSRLVGLSMDNVVEAEIVLADGQLARLHEDEDEEGLEEGPDMNGKDIKMVDGDVDIPFGAIVEEEDPSRSPGTVKLSKEEMRDLWWAFRGAGTCFGIITKIRVKAYPVGMVFSGNLIFPFNPITAPSLIKHWRDCLKGAPRQLYANLILTAGPDPSKHVIIIQLCYVGDRTEGEPFVQAISSWEGERTLLKDVEMRTFLQQQGSVAQVLNAKADNRWYIRSDLVESLSDDAIHRSVKLFRDVPERSAWLFELSAGAIGDIAPHKSCFPPSHRRATYQAAAIHQWKDPKADGAWQAKAHAWIRCLTQSDDEQTSAIPSDEIGLGPFPCFLERDEGKRVSKTFGAGQTMEQLGISAGQGGEGFKDGWDRLKALKQRWDPDGLWTHNFWPR